jgi:transcriptional regulator with XRE-family HTH domain
MVQASSRPKLVGALIKQKRESLGMSQKALGSHFNPAVTIQFISNLERGKTPLPLHHVPTLATALSLSEASITQLLEQEYALKVSGKVSNETRIAVQNSDSDFFQRVYEAYRTADAKTRQEFTQLCHVLLKLR